MTKLWLLLKKNSNGKQEGLSVKADCRLFNRFLDGGIPVWWGPTELWTCPGRLCMVRGGAGAGVVGLIWLNNCIKGSGYMGMSTPSPVNRQTNKDENITFLLFVSLCYHFPSVSFLGTSCFHHDLIYIKQITQDYFFFILSHPEWHETCCHMAKQWFVCLESSDFTLFLWLPYKKDKCVEQF